MSEATKVVVPIGLEQPQPAQERPAPEWARKSLHAVKMPRREVELAPEWVDNGPNVEVKWHALPGATQPIEQSAEPERGFMENHDNNQYQSGTGNNVPSSTQGSAQPPDPMSYDFFSPEDTARFHADNSAYMQSQIDARVQAALTPHMGAFQEAQLQRDYNAAVARYGEDENFQQVMEVALENCAEAAKNGKPFDIVKEYQAANDQSAAKPGKRGNAHLPEAFRDKKRGIGMLGRIMHHNVQTGRAKPFGGRNWKG